MKVLVNGATGLVGFSIMKAFLEAGHEVRASDHPGADFTATRKLAVEVIPADLFDQPALERTVEGMDVVVHVAGMFDYGASDALLDKINHQGTRNMCEAVLAKAPNLKRFVQISSVGVYGQPVKVPCREDFPKRPRNSYEKSKWRGEMAAFEYHQKRGLPVTALRPTLVYGPNARYGHAMFIAALCLYKIKIMDTLFSLRSGPTTSHIHVDDVGRAAVLLAENDAAVGRAFNIADPNPVSGTAFAHALGEPLGLIVRDVVPSFTAIMSAANFMIGSLPLWSMRFINNFLERLWKGVCEEQGLSPSLRLRLDRDWLGYMTGDNAYDVTAIKELGMLWKWPDAVAGLKATIDWYREHEWIP